VGGHEAGSEKIIQLALAQTGLLWADEMGGFKIYGVTMIHGDRHGAQIMTLPVASNILEVIKSSEQSRSKRIYWNAKFSVANAQVVRNGIYFAEGHRPYRRLFLAPEVASSVALMPNGSFPKGFLITAKPPTPSVVPRCDSLPAQLPCGFAEMELVA